MVLYRAYSSAPQASPSKPAMAVAGCRSPPCEASQAGASEASTSPAKKRARNICVDWCWLSITEDGTKLAERLIATLVLAASALADDTSAYAAPAGYGAPEPSYGAPAAEYSD